jgi:hypothetical protein
MTIAFTDTLRYSGVLPERVSCQCLSRSRVASIVCMGGIIAQKTGARARRRFIAPNGSITVGQSRPAGMSTTKTATAPTTCYPTLSWSMVVSTTGSTPQQCTPLARSSRLAIERVSWLRSGMHRQKGWRGIRRTGSERGTTVSGTLSSVSNAGETTHLRTRTSPNSVTLTAGLQPFDGVVRGKPAPRIVPKEPKVTGWHIAPPAEARRGGIRL